jgi:hypothetical protein
MATNNFNLRHSINGDAVIGFMSAKKMQTLGWMDAAKVSTYLLDDEGQSHRKHLGMINLFQTTHEVEIPFMKDLFEDSAVLECGEDESITYDLPVSRTEVKCYSAVDTSGKYDFPGIDEGVFELVLSQEFTKGDILTYDPQYGEQVMVSSQHEVERVGENFRHYVVYMTNDKTAYFPKDKLIAGLQWMKIGNALAELDTGFSSVNMIKNPAGSITCEFILGSPRGVETFMTAKAYNMKAPGLAEFTGDMMDSVKENLRALGGSAGEMFWMAKSAGSEGFYDQTMKVGATLEYLVLLELAMMEAYSLLFAKAATINTDNGTKRVNEGVWHQIRRGKLIKYAKPGGITIDHLHEVASYIYKNNTKIKPKNRTLKFKCGWYAHQNMKQIIRTEAIQQLNGIPAGMLGTDAQIGKVFSGNLDSLQMNAVAIDSVFIPGVGQVEVEHDPSLDYQPLSDRFSAKMFGEGMAHTSYSMVIWDVTNPMYSNVTSTVNNAELVEGGSKTANIYYIKPEGSHVTYGYEQGRMEDRGQNTYVKSSLKQMGKTFWATSQSGALVLDTTRYVVIELQL